jgi:thiamine-monophosphate kinase
MSLRENDFLHWLYAQGGPSEAVPVGPGDDMAVVRFDRDRLLVACDQVLDGVHVRLADCGYQAAGRKAMLRNLSDVAAMAALPVGAVASVALPRDATEDDAKALHCGMTSLGEEFSCPLVGGDTSVWDHPLAISLTVFAKPAGATGGIHPIIRQGARAGQAICVTGALGGAWRTGRDLTATPRVREAIILAFRYHLRSMIDISDGLAMDLGRVCRAGGGLGAEIWADAVPIHPDAVRRAEQDGGDPLRAALGDGEDYELLFTLARGPAGRLVKDQKIPLPVTQIGVVTKEHGLVLVHPDGRRDSLDPTGWEHGR